MKLVQLKSIGERWQLQHCAVKPVPHVTSQEDVFEDGSGLEHAIVELMQESGMNQTQVACSMTGPAVIVKSIHVPTMTEAELNEHLAWEMDRYVSFDVSEVYWDCHIPDVQDRETSLSTMSALLVVAKKQEVQKRIELLQRAGLDPLVVDVETLALSNMYAVNYGDREPTGALLVHVSPSGIGMIALYRGHPLYMREVAYGENWNRDACEQAFGGPMGQKSQPEPSATTPASQQFLMMEGYAEITKAVRTTIEFCWDTIPNRRPESLCLCGGYAGLPGLAERLQHDVKLPAEIVNPFRNLELSPALKHDHALPNLAPLVGVAVGLALRCIGEP